MAYVIAVMMATSGLALIFFSHSHAVTHQSVQPAPSPSSLPVQLNLTGATFASWALLDLRTGQISGSPNLDAAGDTMSMIKAWIAADYLRRASKKPDDETLTQLAIMIRDSDNDIATEFHNRNGTKASIDRMVIVCGLTESHPGKVAYRWSDTVISARDTARLGGCISDGRAAGPWTVWLMTQMRLVRGDGDFGARKAFPAEVARKIAIKNGWYAREEDGQWHFACLAIGNWWSLGVLIRYPAKAGQDRGEKLCRAAGEQLRTVLS